MARILPPGDPVGVNAADLRLLSEGLLLLRVATDDLSSPAAVAPGGVFRLRSSAAVVPIVPLFCGDFSEIVPGDFLLTVLLTSGSRSFVPSETVFLAGDHETLFARACF